MMECCVPPGFRFHPTDEELVGYYLRKKVASQKIDLDVIRDIDLYRIEPWDLQERCRIGYEEQNEWYFFSHKDKKYPTGTRTNRATMAGFWKATGRDKAIYDKGKLIGMRKTLVFYKGRAPNGLKSDWIMHEYRLECDDNAPPQEEGWVVCRAFKKRITSQTKNNNIEGWDSSSRYLYHDESSVVSSVLDPIDHYNNISSSRQPQNLLAQNNMLCKQELEAENNLGFMMQAHDTFVQLPQLESPSLPLIKRPSSASLVPSQNVKNNKNNDEDVEQSKRVTDWRALDKFVASQLSNGDNAVSCSFGAPENGCEISPLMLLQNEKDEDDQEQHKFNGLLSSSSEFDIGICIFEK